MPAVKAFAFNDPTVEISAPIVIIAPPDTPRILVAANAKGADDFINSLAGTMSEIAILTSI